jgi:LmbE family N-acetylglucosaminyl deacetylase
LRPLSLSLEAAASLRVLCLGAHSDDIEIGCGGTILRLIRQYPQCSIHWVVFSAIGIRGEEAQQGASLFAGANVAGLHLKTFQDSFMPFNGAPVKTFFEELKPLAPDLVLTHNRKDSHQDHRLLAELTWNAFRDHLILEYEIPKYDGDMGQPNFFVPLESEIYQEKVRHLMEVFGSQRSKRWFCPETFLGLMRLRGMECNSPSGYAEAFFSRKLTL